MTLNANKIGWTSTSSGDLLQQPATAVSAGKPPLAFPSNSGKSDALYLQDFVKGVRSRPTRSAQHRCNEFDIGENGNGLLCILHEQYEITVNKARRVSLHDLSAETRVESAATSTLPQLGEQLVITTRSETKSDYDVVANEQTC